MATYTKTPVPCPKCGYNVAAARESHCSGCGTPIQPVEYAAINRSGPGLSWIVLLVVPALAIPLGYSLRDFGLMACASNAGPNVLMVDRIGSACAMLALLAIPGTSIYIASKMASVQQPNTDARPRGLPTRTSSDDASF
jgi:hypothetical protein